MSQEVVKVNHLCKTIGKRKILQDVTFTVNEGDAIGIGSGGNYAYSAALAYLDAGADMDAKEIAKKSILIASSICVFTNTNIIVEEL